MALFDQTLLLYHATGTYAFSAGEFVSLVGVTSTCTSTIINLGNARDLGIGDGQERPQVMLVVGTAVTSSSAGVLMNIQFQGSSNSVLWTTYAETPYTTTASWTAGQYFQLDVPRRPNGAALPLYYQAVINQVGPAYAATTSGVSTGTIIGGIVLARPDATDTYGLYPAGFTVS